MSYTAKILVAMVLGIVVGIALNLMGASSNEIIDRYLIEGIFATVGTLFINALKMLVVPLVFISLMVGVLGIGDIGKLGRIGIKTFALYLLTTALAISVAIGVAVTVGIGEGSALKAASAFMPKEAPPLSEVILSIVPTNIFEAFVQGNMLQVIFIAILAAVSILMVGEGAKQLVALIETLNEVMMKMVYIVMAAAPVGVFSLLAKTFSKLGFTLFVDLLGYVVLLIGLLLFHLFGTLQLILKLFSGLSPLVYLRKFKNVILFAFSTSSSNATIPVTLEALTKRLGASPSVASFSVPFGATINMDGTAIMQGVATVFVANLYGIELGFGDYLTIVLMAVVASIGTAGVPGVGMIMLSMVFAQVGLPVEAIGLLLGVDRLLDMVRTAVNVTGDGAVTLIVAKSEKSLDQKRFEAEQTVEVEAPSIDPKDEKLIAKTVERLQEKLEK